MEFSHGRPAPTDMDIHPLISYRWSPRAISSRPVETEKVKLVLEAARWAPSSFNEQPWRFLVATADQAQWLEQLQSYLSSGNAWAKSAPVLIASAYRTHFTRNNKPNPSALRDLGAAEQNMTLQAYAAGLVMHQIAGFDRQRLKRELLPEGFEPGAISALGYLSDADPQGEKLQERERRSRLRNPLADFVFGPRWGEAAAFL